jgi:hypothetical protein
LFTGSFPKYHCARFIDFLLITDVFSLVGIVCAILRNVSSEVLNRDMANIHLLMKGLVDDDGIMVAGSRNLWEPELIIEKAREYNFPRKELLKLLHEYHNSLEPKTKGHFSRYFDHFDSYLKLNTTRKSEGLVCGELEH